MEGDDPNGASEGRSNLREVTREEYEAHRTAYPDADWNISTPVGVEGPERYFVPAIRLEHRLIGDMLMNATPLGCKVKD